MQLAARFASMRGLLASFVRTPGHTLAGVRAAKWPSLGEISAVVGLLTFASLLGAACAVLPPILLIALVLAVVYPIALWAFPWTGLFVYALIIFLSPDLKLSDLVSAVTLAIYAITLLAKGQFQRLPKGVFASYMIFMGMAVLSLVLAVIYFGHEKSYIYGDGRGFVYWLWLPVLYALVTSSADGWNKLVRCIAAIATVVAVVAVVQYATGLQIVASGRVGALDTIGASQGEHTRVQMHGFTFVLFCFVWAVVSMVYRRRPWWMLLPAIGLLLIALYVNFGRALWILSALALVISLIFMDRRRAIFLALLLVFSSGVGVAALAAFKPNTLDVLLTRLVSVKDEGGARTSLGWRKLENLDAVSHIAQSPVVGVGMGGEYRRWMYEVSNFKEHTRYVHNSYYFIALKFGVPALGAVLTLLILSWWRGRAAVKKMPESPERTLLIAGLATLPALLGLAVTQPELVNAYSVLLLCFVLTGLLTSGDSQRLRADRQSTR